MSDKKFTVYYNNKVDEFNEVFASDTLQECKEWISRELQGKTPVHSCSESIFWSAKTFNFQIYDRPVIEIIDDEEVCNDPIFESKYYYSEILF